MNSGNESEISFDSASLGDGRPGLADQIAAILAVGAPIKPESKEISDSHADQYAHSKGPVFSR